MTVQELINSLQQQVAGGVDPNSIVLAYDADSKDWEIVSSTVYEPAARFEGKIQPALSLYTDAD